MLDTAGVSPGAAVNLVRTTNDDTDLVGVFARQAGVATNRDALIAQLHALDPLLATGSAARWIEANG